MKNFEFKKLNLDFRNDKSGFNYLRAFILILIGFVVSVIKKRKVTHVFWYSQNQDDLPDFGRKNNQMPTFNGSPYSEMSNVEHGWSNWSDAKIVGFGSVKDIVFKSRYYR